MGNLSISDLRKSIDFYVASSPSLGRFLFGGFLGLSSRFPGGQGRLIGGFDGLSGGLPCRGHSLG
jgi:hypothetical protein